MASNKTEVVALLPEDHWEALYDAAGAGEGAESVSGLGAMLQSWDAGEGEEGGADLKGATQILDSVVHVILRFFASNLTSNTFTLFNRFHRSSRGIFRSLPTRLTRSPTMPRASKGGFYAVQNGRQTGVFTTW